MLITNYVTEVKNILTKKICIKKLEDLTYVMVILRTEVQKPVPSNKTLDCGVSGKFLGQNLINMGGKRENLRRRQRTISGYL